MVALQYSTVIVRVAVQEFAEPCFVQYSTVQYSTVTFPVPLCQAFVLHWLRALNLGEYSTVTLQTHAKLRVKNTSRSTALEPGAIPCHAHNLEIAAAIENAAQTRGR